MADVITASVKAIVRNALSTFWGTGSELQLEALAHGQLGMAAVHGDYFEATFRGKVFTANVTAVQIQVVASAMVSVFTLYNPPGSNVVGEILRTTIGQVLVTTVVNAIGWYSSTSSATALGTFTTLASARSGLVQSPASNAIQFYSAYTHSGTPTREDIIGSFGGITDPGLALPDKRYNGQLLLPPGIAMSIGSTTATSFTSGLDIQATWAEWPSA